MRHPGFMAAFAERVGDLDELSSFIIIFLVCTVVTCFWNDFSRRSHPQTRPAAQEEELPQLNRRIPAQEHSDGQINDKMERI